MKIIISILLGYYSYKLIGNSKVFWGFLIMMIVYDFLSSEDRIY